MIYMATGWRYWWRRWLGWLPVQFCIVCQHAYFAGLPRPGWRPWYSDFCSGECARQDEFNDPWRSP